MTKATQERETPVSVRSGVGAEPVIDEPRIRETRILIVGGGLSGICTAAKLQACGESDVRLIERAGTFGGTWRDNTYPGCACDIPSPTYSFAFAPNPRWSKLFAPREEIQQYLLDLAENFRTSEVTDFDTELERAEWDAETRRWIVRTNRDTYIAQILIMATGLFKNAVIPPLDGVDTFEGAVFHSSKWDHDVDLRGKRVAVVGTGASALQFIPKIQPEVAALTVCQRTPIWVMPKLDPRFGPITKSLFRLMPFTQRALRSATTLGFEALLVSARDAKGLKALEAVARWNMRRQVKDPALRAVLEPSYRIGCKRVSASNEYYPALAAPNTTVAPAAVGLRPDAIVTADGRSHRADVVIFATGFEVQISEAYERIVGRSGQTLGDTWRGTAEAYLTGFAGFPNLFALFGPFSANAGGGFNQADQQSDYIVLATEAMRSQGLEVVEVRPDVQQRFVDEMRVRLAKSVWELGGCQSYYIDAKGRANFAYPGTHWEFGQRMNRFDTESYDVVTLDGVDSVRS